jgi:hypothetical protein
MTAAEGIRLYLFEKQHKDVLAKIGALPSGAFIDVHDWLDHIRTKHNEYKGDIK